MHSPVCFSFLVFGVFLVGMDGVGIKGVEKEEESFGSWFQGSGMRNTGFQGWYCLVGYVAQRRATV